ncbi:MAG: hypothetical protein JWP35_2635 [Caulobacter sp.]|nr:hypothetical protein [Caulobacter sp.]
MIRTSVIVAAALALAACHAKPAAPATDAASSPADAGAPRDRTDAALLAAADAFQALTENAYGLTPPRLEAQVGAAHGAAVGVRAQLSPQAQTDLTGLLTRLDDALAADDRAGVALAAVEVYRLLIGGVRHPGKAPPGVGLLAYAGLRYDAGRRSTPERWDDMAEAVAIARDQWLAVSPRIKDAALLGQMDKAIADMAAAAARRDPKSAGRAAKGEMDLIDDLQGYFNKG